MTRSRRPVSSSRLASGFHPGLSLPKKLSLSHLEKAIDFVEQETAQVVELYYEQANVFSGIVGIFGVKALDSISPYKKHKHPDVAQQRFPDLSLGGRISPPPSEALESKGSTRAYAVQSHYNHSGWYIVWRYLVDPTRRIKSGREVVVWAIDIPFLHTDDWKYEGSGAGAGRGGRTHTFGVKTPKAKIEPSRVFLHPLIVLSGGKPTLR